MSEQAREAVKHIGGWCDFHGFYDQLAEECPDGEQIAEIGSWLGHSICYLGLKIKELGKDIRLTAVDLWPNQHMDVTCGDTYLAFEEFTTGCGVRDMINMVHKASSIAANDFLDGEFFAVFIDADHGYTSVKEDIAAWLPKVRKGGILCGHDYDNNWPGVMKAVNETFGKELEFIGSCWIHRV